MMPVLLAVVLLVIAGTVSAQTPAQSADATLTLETLFSPHDLGALEQLVTTAQKNNPAVAEAEGALTLNTAETELLGPAT